ncbi:hypothetical protein E1301_Tti005448 [Triplophysa tibetana]|uniref:Uncharacterized protein n=1 Tax=Triplophysa tibetana TaxID=1572043 RepID=A0A5A9PQN9_9TELE|nr:hypothetical protein E1301_Tti005448 [Triplophysa tibetana]
MGCKMLSMRAAHEILRQSPRYVGLDFTEEGCNRTNALQLYCRVHQLNDTRRSSLEEACSLSDSNRSQSDAASDMSSSLTPRTGL